LVVVDGLLTRHVEYLELCETWHDIDRERHRLLIVSSLSSRGKAHPEDDLVAGIKEHFVYSWKLEEYYAAIQEQNFYDSVKEYLDSMIDVDNLNHARIIIIRSKEDQIASKYYFAGGSARLMFRFTTREIVNLLNQSINSVAIFRPDIFFGVGLLSDAIINRLFNVYEEKSNKTIVSEYAANEVARIQGPRLIEDLYDATKGSSNPAMDGCLRCGFSLPSNMKV